MATWLCIPSLPFTWSIAIDAILICFCSALFSFFSMCVTYNLIFSGCLFSFYVLGLFCASLHNSRHDTESLHMPLQMVKVCRLPVSQLKSCSPEMCIWSILWCFLRNRWNLIIVIMQIQARHQRMHQQMNENLLLALWSSKEFWLLFT